MCGIAGFVGKRDQDIIRLMTTALAHRGPDGDSSWLDPEHPVTLGHRRLSIIDIAGGSQPMIDSDHRAVIVFNGEIYNHRTIRRRLETLGHHFKSSHSDTEVLLIGYLEWGERIVDELDGMFAFALFDRQKRRLILGRDRFGEKPLYYAETPDGLVFASELTAVIAHPAVGREISALAIMKFFAHGFFPAHWTPYRAVRKLRAGHIMCYDLAARQLQISTYWSYRIQPNSEPKGTIAEWGEEIVSLLKQSVADRMLEADVPVGIFLSGGIDSGAVLSLAAAALPTQELNAFNIAFREKSFDESAYARIMAKHVGVNLHTDTCDLTAATGIIADILPRLDEPTGDGSIVPTFMLSRFARQSVKVALGGDGGDELFAGYDPFRVLSKAALYHRWMTRPLHAAISHAAAVLPPSDVNLGFQFKLNRGLRGLRFRPALWNPVWLSALGPKEIEELFATQINPEDLYSEAIELWDQSHSTSLLDRSMEFYGNMYLTDGVLQKSDRASMLNSLELRAPFLANNLVDYVCRLPSSVKLKAGQGKWLLRTALRRHLPKEIIMRPKKGFGMPISAWIRDLAQPAANPNLPFRDDYLRGLWIQHRERKIDQRSALWCWLSLSAALDRTTNIRHGLQC